MRYFFTLCSLLMLLMSSVWAQDVSMVFYNGGLPDSMYLWPWGFETDPAEAPGTGYTPGTNALRWATSADDGWQGEFIGLNSNVGNDLSTIWDTESVHFKLKAPNGLAVTDTLIVYLYDSRNSDWDFSVYYNLTNFHDIEDGNWHSFSIPLADFTEYKNAIHKNDIVAVSFEAPIEGFGIASEFYIDHIWIGSPNVRQEMTLWNGAALPNGVSGDAVDVSGGTFTTVPNAGFAEGTPAILWENGTADYAYIGFQLSDPPAWTKYHDLTGSWAVDSLKIKIKAPADIAELYLSWYDWEDDYAWYELAGPWDGTWKEFKIPLADFNFEGDFNTTTIYYLAIESYSMIADSIYFDDIWIGNPYIDFTPPPAPGNILVDGSTVGYNIISWDDIGSELGEVYDVYGSESPIADLNSTDVFVVATGVTDFDAVHYFYSPLVLTESSFYYAVNCIDAAGNESETFGKTETATSNSGKVRAIISMDPITFSADGNLDEWSDIRPFRLNPDAPYNNIYTGEITDSLDYSAKCWVAMDETNLYVAFDVYDDVFSWTADNTVDWWEDECIEFYIGLYQNEARPHDGWETGGQPDYRIEFRPDLMRFSMGEETVAEGTDNYYFQPLGAADYIVEAKIPFASLRQEGDSSFTPVEGMTVPFEIFAADADVPDGYNESRLQFGDNPALNPWSDGPKSWTFAWVGTSGYYTAIENGNSGIAATYKLGNNYPNPFNPTTTIEYSIALPGKVELTVYNTIGQKVATLVNQVKAAGSHEVLFDAKNLASGTYFYQLRSKGFTQVKKMLILK